MHEINHYFNRRFYKYTEIDCADYPEMRLNHDKRVGKSLYVAEGPMLPTATELNFAKKCKFDLYTLTNLSFADLATHLGVDYDLKAVEVEHFGDQLTSLNWSDEKANR